MGDIDAASTERTEALHESADEIGQKNHDGNGDEDGNPLAADRLFVRLRSEGFDVRLSVEFGIAFGTAGQTLAVERAAFFTKLHGCGSP